MRFDSLQELLDNQYQFASQPFERQLPLPSISKKVPFKEKKLRLLNINSEKKQIEEIRQQISRKVELDELQYQNKIRQMRKQNEEHQRIIQQRINNPHKGIFFDLPQLTSNKTSKSPQLRDSLDDFKDINQYIGSHRRQIPRKITQTSRRKTASDVDDVNKSGKRTTRMDFELDEEEEKQKRVEAESERRKQMDYIYNRLERPQNNKHFSLEPTKKQQDKEEKDADDYEWVNKVRKERKRLYLSEIEEKSSSRSSDESSSN